MTIEYSSDLSCHPSTRTETPRVFMLRDGNSRPKDIESGFEPGSAWRTGTPSET